MEQEHKIIVDIDDIEYQDNVFTLIMDNEAFLNPYKLVLCKNCGLIQNIENINIKLKFGHCREGDLMFNKDFYSLKKKYQNEIIRKIKKYHVHKNKLNDTYEKIVLKIKDVDIKNDPDYLKYIEEGFKPHELKIKTNKKVTFMYEK